MNNNIMYALVMLPIIITPIYLIWNSNNIDNKEETNKNITIEKEGLSNSGNTTPTSIIDN